MQKKTFLQEQTLLSGRRIRFEKASGALRRGFRAMGRAGLGIALYAAVLWGCEGGQIVLGEGSCVPGGDTCPPGEICQATDSPGWGICVAIGPLTGTCELNRAKECGPDEICLNTADTPPGRGRCLAIAEGECAVGSDTDCPQEQLCLHEEGLAPGRGLCVSRMGDCALGSDADCPQGQTCQAVGGLALGRGRCMPTQEGVCTLPDGWECQPGMTCQDTADTPPNRGRCTPGGEGGEGEVSPEAVVKGWKLLQGGEETLPLSEEGGGNNPNAGWLGAGPIEVEVVTEGPGSGAGLRVHSTQGGEAATCQVVEKAAGLDWYRWRCTFPNGLQGDSTGGQEGTANVQVSLDGYTWQNRVYRVQREAPEVSFTATDGGATLTLCAEANAKPNNAPATSVSFGNIATTLNGNNLALAWTVTTNEATRKCQSANLPPNMNDSDRLTFSAEATVTDAAHNTATRQMELSWTRNRIAASGQLSGFAGVVQPLVWADNRLVIRTRTRPDQLSEQIYFLSSNGGYTSFESGASTGLTALGNSGRLAMTRLISQATLVNSSGAISGTGCSFQQPGSFSYGLTLLSMGDAAGTQGWRFAMPMNDNTTQTGNNRLVAYIPESARCIQSPSPLSTMPVAHLIGLSNSEVLLTRDSDGTRVERWSWNHANSSWGNSVPLGFLHNTDTLSSVAATSRQFWATATDMRLRRLDMGEGGLHKSTAFNAIGEVALDAGGRAYVVAREAGSGAYALYRFAADMTGDPAAHQRREVLPEETGGPVGSPILGEPVGNSPAEVYVVTTDGKVFAFEAESMRPLWTETLRRNHAAVSVAASAQPVLNANRLWIIGSQGEWFAVAVNSNGLHKTAQWPKVHRDNCNTSSHVSTPATLPSCF